MALTAKEVYAILKHQISDMEAKLNSPVRYRGTVATADLLPLNPDIGDMYNIESKSIYGEAGMNVAWNGIVWDTMGAPIDMSLYFTKEEANTTIQNMVNEYIEKNPVKPGATTEQAQQIEQNKTDIASLKEKTNSLKGEKADTLDYKNSILRLLSGETELSRVIIRGGSGSGVDAREIELRKSATAIQWRYTGDETWNDLVALAEITGAQGEQGQAGEPGKDGRGITSVTIKADGHLRIDYSDGTEVDVGKVTGNDGLDGASGVPVRIEKTSSDSTSEIDSNKLYIFPEMSSLTYTLATPSDTSVSNEYHFVFRSGATATELVHPANVSVPDNFTVEKNKVYEISILEGCLSYQSWAVS